ncbi:MAG: alpha/beta hydrolase [Granulosicoccus sp.]
MSIVVRHAVLCVVALLSIGLSVYHLEQARAGIQFSTLDFGETPATRYRLPDAQGPMVIVTHGFAGSRQLMQAFSLTLARAGYDVIAFDFEGHGRNPIPMSGDVTAIDGTTRLLVEETQRVITAAKTLNENNQGIALLGHSMATDVILRAALAEMEKGVKIATIVGVSMFSELINESVPPSLLIVNGQWEGRLRAPALKQLQMLNPQAVEGETVSTSDVVRRVVVVPSVEHVSVLYSGTTLQETLAWLDMTFNRSSSTDVARIGGWILLLLGGIVFLFKPLVYCLPKGEIHKNELPTKTFFLAVALPAIVTPLLAFMPSVNFLPVLVADYLMMHLALFGALQLFVIRSLLPGLRMSGLLSGVLLALWGIVVFGLALDRYAASFLPTGGRLVIIGVLCLGTIVFMVADCVVTGVGTGSLWRRILARVALMVSLGVAAVIDPDRLIFLLIILPVLVLFYLVHGLMGRWVAQRSGALTTGVGLGLCLAWALGVSFPLFDVQ